MDIHRPKRRKLMGEINVVPLIDVMLVLLIVFMVTAPLMTQGIKIDLPDVDATPMEENIDVTLELAIDAAGQYFISLGEIEPENPEPVPLESIAENVTKILNQNPDVPVYVRADTSIQHGVVMNLYSVLEKAGAKSISVITEPPGTNQ